METVKCAYCGDMVVADRPSKKYCSDKCRVAYHRLKDKIENDAKQVAISIRIFADYAERYPEYEGFVFHQLQMLAYTLGKPYNAIKWKKEAEGNVKNE